jgi:serine/threonine-protein kinase
VIGELIGSYRITAKVGEGGMGVVYAAEHPLIGRKVAVKVLLPELSNDQEMVNRFFNEARACGMIRHPGLVDIFDFGYHRSGSAYIVMEFLEGSSLTDTVRKQGRPPLAVSLAVARQIASALGAAHAKGITHRDLKPDNIFLVPDSDAPYGYRVKLLDFGIAKLQNDPSQNMHKTKTGSVLGTPLYMSPEQCRGSGQVDWRADIYSLGCMLYELACGRPPIVADGFGEILAKHIYEMPRPPSAFDPSVPAIFEQVIMKALAKNPAERQQSMAEITQSLDRITGTMTPPPFAAMHPATMPMMYPPSYTPQPGSMVPPGTPPPGSMLPPGTPPPGALPPPMPIRNTPPPDQITAPAVWPPGGPQPTPPPGTIPTAVIPPPGEVTKPMTTTNRSAAAEVMSVTAARPPSSRGKLLIPLLVGLTLVGVGIALVASRGSGSSGAPAKAADQPKIEANNTQAPAAPIPAPAPPPVTSAAPAPQVPAAPKTIHVQIDSTPPGAIVLLNGSSVGKTPYSVDVVPSSGPTAYSLRLDGYKDKPLDAPPADKDYTQSVTLEKNPPAHSGPHSKAKDKFVDPFAN